MMRAPARLFAPLLVLLLALAACGEDPTVAPIADDAPTPTAATPDPDEDATPQPPDDDTQASLDPDQKGATESTAYFVREGETDLWVEPETHALDEPTVGVAKAAMEQLVAGNTIDPGLSTLAPEGTEVLGVRIDGDVLEVDLSEDVLDHNLGSGAEGAFAQQLAHTAAQFDGIEQVLLLVEGETIDSLAGHGDWSEPIAPDSMALSPITFESHHWSEEVEVGAVTVGGRANTFEATVELALYGPDGELVEETFTTATAGMGERGEWEHRFELTEPGRWRIEAIEPDPSDGEGRPPFRTVLELDVS